MEEQRVGVSVKYKIYFIENGLLLEPKYSWGDKIFDTYDSQQEAAQAILKENHWQELVILPTIAGIHFVYDDDF